MIKLDIKKIIDKKIKLYKINKKYNIVKKNRYWNYNNQYVINGITIEENDLTYNLSKYLINNLDKENPYNQNNLQLVDGDTDKMLKIVTNFFKSINPNFEKKLNYIIPKINFIDSKGRSVTNDEGIFLYNEDNLETLITLAHEISHALSNLSIDNDKCYIDNKNKLGIFTEIESIITEDLFLKYLYKNNYEIKDENQKRTLTEKDIDNIKYNKIHYNVIEHIHRVIDEITFRKNEEKIKQLDENTINGIYNDKDFNKNYKKINMFLNRYYDPNKKNYENNYDLKNGKNLSNETRFIYAYLFLEMFNSKIKDEQKKFFYIDYINNNKNYTFEDVLSKFNINITSKDELIEKISDCFITNYKNLTNKFSNPIVRR